MIDGDACAPEPVLNAFAPIGATAARLMILGSMPGAASLAETEYYAHPRNAFWPVLQALCSGSINTYSEKKQLLIANHIVVWDVLTQCIRPGSLDANIRADSIVCNNFAELLDIQTTISRIAFNGKAAEQLFRKHVIPTLDVNFTHSTVGKCEHAQSEIDTTDATAAKSMSSATAITSSGTEADTAAGTATRTIQLVPLPSTSPAMASLSTDAKIQAWRTALLQGVK